MLVFAILLGLFAVFHIPGLNRLSALRSRRDKAAFALAGMFLFTGIDHFATPGRYLPMMPPYLPAHLPLIYVSGFFELLGAAGLTIRRTRRAAAFGLIALLIAVFQANLYVAINGITLDGLPANPLYYWIRLPLQFGLIAWAWWVSRPERETA